MKGGVVLLVEGNSDHETLFLRVLKKSNLANEVQVARDGAEALDYLFGTGVYEGRGVAKPAVVFLDIKLPKVGGLEVLKRLRGDERTKRVPVVILTAAKRPEDIIRSYELGANSYVRKPLSPGEFVAAISRLGLCWLLLSEPPRAAG